MKYQFFNFVCVKDVYKFIHGLFVKQGNTWTLGNQRVWGRGSQLKRKKWKRKFMDTNTFGSTKTFNTDSTTPFESNWAQD